MKKNILFCALAIMALNIKLSAQGIFVSRVFQNSRGTPLFNPVLNTFGVEWSKSIIHSSGYLITVGYTTVSGQGQNVFLTKYNSDGTLIWQQDYNISGTSNDYGIGLAEAANGDILIVGTTDNGGTSYDLIAMRVSVSTGSQLTTPLVKDGAANLNDVGVSIIEGSSGIIYIAGNSENMPGLSNYWVIQCDHALSYINDNTYDYAGFPDIALGMEFTTGGDICLIGASASGSTSCDYAAVTFDAASLAFIADSRDNLTGTALDQALAFCKDASGNIYITGKAWNGTNFDIKTFKINANFTIGWISTALDVHGLDDVANTIAVNPVTGDVIVAGYATKTNNKQEMIFVRYNGSTGSLINDYKQSSEDNTGDAFVQTIHTNASGDIYFIGGEKGNSGNKQAVVGKLKANTATSWQKQIANASMDILPSDLDVASDGIYAISILDSTVQKYVTTKYEELELDTAKISYGGAQYKDGELIVRFLPAAMDVSAINDGEKTFGQLQDYLTSTAYGQVASAFATADICLLDCNIKAIKIFPGLTTNDSTTTSHLDETIAIPDLWTALLLVLPSNANVPQVNSIFNNLTSVAAYAEPNFLAQLYSVPDDSLYSQQLSIHSSTAYPNSDINMEEAWDVMHNGGKPFIRCGVFDVPVDWEHRDFGYDGVNLSSSKIVSGWDFLLNSNVKNHPNGGATGDYHATCVSGIIGAQRNNHKGIAGIAGGNDSIGSKGISLYNLAVFYPGGNPVVSPVTTPLSYIADAIVTSAMAVNTQTTASNPLITNNYSYRVHLQNHSWGLYMPVVDPGNYNFSNTLFQEAIHTVNRMKVTAVAARGNDHGGQLSYPANCDDDWVINVTGTGVDGQFAHDTVAISGPYNSEFTSGWGGDVDLGAPASGSLIITLSTPNSGSTVTPQPQYQSFGGTSAAAPHVTGAVGFMMSYINDSINNYRNMAPEDCEAILELTAIDTDLPFYDTLTGHGRLNVGKAMKLLEKPYHKLLHFGTNSMYSYTINKTLLSAVDTINLIERFNRRPTNTWFYQTSPYIVKTYKITSTVYHNIGSQDTIKAYWPRPSSSVTFPLFTTVSGVKLLTPREKTKITSINNTSATLEGYIYQVKDHFGNSVGWWPVDTAYIGNLNGYGSWAEYSVLTRNDASTDYDGIKENTTSLINLNVYPNPTSGNQTLVIETNKVCNLTIDLYDMMGRKLKTVYSGKSEPAQTVISHNVGNLPNSLYIYTIKVDGATTSRKFIKQ